jgi:hypothetical protein
LHQFDRPKLNPAAAPPEYRSPAGWKIEAMQIHMECGVKAKKAIALEASMRET